MPTFFLWTDTYRVTVTGRAGRSGRAKAGQDIIASAKRQAQAIGGGEIQAQADLTAKLAQVAG